MAESPFKPDSMFNRENVIPARTTAHGGPAEGVGHIHEERDVPIRGILMFVVVLVVATLVICVALWGMFEILEARSDRSDPELSPLTESNRVPPMPRLQSSPSREMAAFRLQEDSVLRGSGWVDSGSGVASIPIEQAIDMIAERGLPVRGKQAGAGSSRDTMTAASRRSMSDTSGNAAGGAQPEGTAGGRATTPAGGR